MNSYTLECSFLGPRNVRALGRDNNDFHLDKGHLERLGRDLGKASGVFMSKVIFLKKLHFVSAFLRENNPYDKYNKLPQKRPIRSKSC